MYDRNRSGQFVYFSLVSVFSGTPVTGIASGNISGRVAKDGAALGVCAGPIIEDGGGLYHLNAFAADTDFNNAGFLFTASGCNVVAFTALSDQNTSGKLYTAAGMQVNLLSGQTVGIYSGNLSGQGVTTLTNSDKTGYTVLSGTTWLNPGQQVGVLSGQLSGQPLSATVNSGLSVIATLYPNQSVNVNSGNLSGQPLTATVGSGLFVVASLLSGQTVLLGSGSLSGQQVVALTNLDKTGYSVLSGTVNLASGMIAQEIPKAVLTWNFSGAPDVSGIPNLLNAGRLLTNPVSMTALSGKMVVYREDGATVAYIRSVTVQSGAQPMVALGGA